MRNEMDAGQSWGISLVAKIVPLQGTVGVSTTPCSTSVAQTGQGSTLLKASIPSLPLGAEWQTPLSAVHNRKRASAICHGGATVAQLICNQ